MLSSRVPESLAESTPASFEIMPWFRVDIHGRNLQLGGAGDGPHSFSTRLELFSAAPAAAVDDGLKKIRLHPQLQQLTNSRQDPPLLFAEACEIGALAADRPEWPELELIPEAPHPLPFDVADLLDL